jgi:hypothetical protein
MTKPLTLEELDEIAQEMDDYIIETEGPKKRKSRAKRAA